MITYMTLLPHYMICHVACEVFACRMPEEKVLQMVLSK